jgi:hypothetical protein
MNKADQILFKFSKIKALDEAMDLLDTDSADIVKIEQRQNGLKSNSIQRNNLNAVIRNNEETRQRPQPVAKLEVEKAEPKLSIVDRARAVYGRKI